MKLWKPSWNRCTLISSICRQPNWRKMWVLWAKLVFFFFVVLPFQYTFIFRHFLYQIRLFFSLLSMRNFITFLSNFEPSFLHFSRFSLCFLFQGASSLLDMILYYESTTYLDVSDNTSMGTSAWRALAHLIKQVGRGTVIFSLRVSLRNNVYPGKVSFGRRCRAEQTGWEVLAEHKHISR